MATAAPMPQISQRGDAMLSYRGRTAYLVWTEAEADDEDDFDGFEVARLLADSTISIPMGIGKTQDFAKGIENLAVVLGIQLNGGPVIGDPDRYWKDVAGTALDTRALKPVN